jgi:hypothetical protein
MAPNGDLMVATVTAAPTGFQTTSPVKLFSTRITPSNYQKPMFLIHPNGTFLFNERAETLSDPVILILNWKPKDSK